MDHPSFTTEMLKTGYFMLYKHGDDFIGKQIEKHQLAKGIPPELACYVHVDVLGPREWAIRMNPPKAQVVNIQSHYQGREAAMVKYKAVDYEHVRQYVSWWAVSHNNLRYDWLGVIKFKLAFLWHKKDLFFCSENAAWALRKEYPFAFGKVKDHEIFPAHFFNDEFEVVWKGFIQ